LIALTAKRQWGDYRALGVFLIVHSSYSVFGSGILRLCRAAAHARNAAMMIRMYNLYFYLYWCSYVVESILALLIVYSVFRLAMAPLKGIQSLGMLVFRWAASISVAVAFGSAFAPSLSRHDYLMNALSQLQRTQSILTLCLLVFVSFAIRPMGLSFSSRIFGVSLGLGILSTFQLVGSAWISHTPNMQTLFSLVGSVVICATLMIWTAYFALPEPRRRLVLLPTTSPYLRWNQISLALGDSPGFVAVGGVPPEMFAPAELEMMRRSSLKTVKQFPRSVGA
jgi:hypothetical protein